MRCAFEMLEKTGSVFLCFVLILYPFSAMALGDIGGGDLAHRIDLEITPLHGTPLSFPEDVVEVEEERVLLELLHFLDDMEEPDREDRAILDPSYFEGVLKIGPAVHLLLKSEESWFLKRLFALVFLYNGFEDRWVCRRREAGEWRDDQMLLRLAVRDGGSYDLDGLDNGRVEVALALGVGLVEEDHETGIRWSIGGCRAGVFPAGVLLPILMCLVCR